MRPDDRAAQYTAQYCTQCRARLVTPPVWRGKLWYAVPSLAGELLYLVCAPMAREVAKTLQRWEDTGMTYVIAEPCVDVLDQACVDVCPVDCIHFEEGKDRMLYIEPDECIDCGACEPECPVEAIFTEEDVPDEWKPYTEINVLWFNDKDGARAKINEIRPE